MCRIAVAVFSLSLASAAPHVVIFGVDGLGAQGFRNAQAPRMDRLRCEGSSTVHARGVMPTVSSPNWASMIMGAGPEQHGITSNDWKPDRFAQVADLLLERHGLPALVSFGPGEDVLLADANTCSPASQR